MEGNNGRHCILLQAIPRLHSASISWAESYCTVKARAYWVSTGGIDTTQGVNQTRTAILDNGQLYALYATKGNGKSCFVPPSIKLLKLTCLINEELKSCHY
jgi:hypothetical protein